MQQVVRATSPITQDTTKPILPKMPAQMVERAASRFCWLALICAITSFLSFMLQRLLQPEVLRAQQNPLMPLMMIGMVLVSVGILLLWRQGLVSAQNLLYIGVAFEVLVGFVIGFFETRLPFEDAPVRGISMIAVWLTVVGLLIPNTPATSLVAAFSCATMWPLAYYMNLQLGVTTALPWNRLAAWLYPTYLMAMWTYFLNKRIFSMEYEAHRAQELGSYALEYLIGRGGMGEVWKARHRMLRREAAIKLIRHELLTQQSGRHAELTVKRFEREARVTAHLQCPHTVYLFDFGVARDGAFYYVMELLDGISLQTLVDKFGPQPASRVCHIVGQACRSLEEAHRTGLVHRDIKPSNIFVCSVGLQKDFVKVLDFGLVKTMSGQGASLVTFEGTAAGTPAYMAPEVAMGDSKVDGRADIYALGCVAYFLLTGHMVFEESTPTATALAHVQKEPVPPSFRTELPVCPVLERIVLQCLSKNPEDRPRSAQELERMLAASTETGRWTEESAFSWWQSHLPLHSEYRSAKRKPEAERAVELLPL